MTPKAFIDTVKQYDHTAKVAKGLNAAALKKAWSKSVPANALPDLQSIYQSFNGLVIRPSYGSKDGSLRILSADRLMNRAEVVDAEFTMVTEFFPDDGVLISLDANGDGYYVYRAKKKCFTYLEQDGNVRDAGRNVSEFLDDVAKNFLLPRKPNPTTNAIWATDGSSKKTVEVKAERCTYSALHALPQGLVYSAEGGNRRDMRLIRLRNVGDAYPTAIPQVWGESFLSVPIDCVSLGERLIFAVRLAGGKLGIGHADFVYDFDTINKPKIFKEIADSSPADASCHMTQLGKLVFFVVSAREDEHQLWRTDGTPGGTKCVRSFEGSRPHSLVVASERLFFIASEDGKRR